MVLSEILKCPSEPATVIMAVSIVPAVSLLADTLEIWASPDASFQKPAFCRHQFLCGGLLKSRKFTRKTGNLRIGGI